MLGSHEFQPSPTVILVSVKGGIYAVRRVSLGRHKQQGWKNGVGRPVLDRRAGLGGPAQIQECTKRGQRTGLRTTLIQHATDGCNAVLIHGIPGIT